MKKIDEIFSDLQEIFPNSRELIIICYESDIKKILSSLDTPDAIGKIRPVPESIKATAFHRGKMGLYLISEEDVNEDSLRKLTIKKEKI